MIEILDPIDSTDRGGKSHVSLDISIDKQLKQIDNAVSYYQSKPIYINANHILRRILFSIDEGDKTELAIFNKVRDSIYELSLLYGITTDINKGDIHYNDFPYSKGTYLMSVDTLNITDVLNKNWRSLKPLSMVYKPYVSNYLDLPHSSSDEIDTYCMMTIDLPCLSVKYFKWAKENNNLPANIREDVSDFISKYILAELIRDSARLSYIELFNTFELGKIKNNVPFAYVDYFSKMYEDIIDIRSEYTREGRHHSNMLKEVRCLDLPNFYSAFPNTYDERITIANRWFKFMSESQIILSVLNTVRNDDDKDVLLRFRVQSRILKGNGALKSSPEKETNKYIQSLYEQIEEMVSSR